MRAHALDGVDTNTTTISHVFVCMCVGVELRYSLLVDKYVDLLCIIAYIYVQLLMCLMLSLFSTMSCNVNINNYNKEI